jgi:tetratricopeptide (TPR) repeat protein
MARVCYAKALELDPEDLDVCAGLARLNYLEGDFGGASRECRKALSLDSLDPTSVELAGFLELRGGNLPRAKALFECNLESDSLGEGFVALGCIYEKMGETRNAVTTFQRSEKCLRNDLAAGDEWSDVPYCLAVLSACRNDKQAAYDWLEKAVDKGLLDYRWAQADPLLRMLSGEQRFQQLIGRMKQSVDEQRSRVMEMSESDSARK